MAIRAIEAGHNLMIEKPAARTAAELEAVAAAAKATATATRPAAVVSLPYVMRYHPASIRIRDDIARGMLGEITSFEMRWIASQVKFRDPDHWLFKKEIAGGGILTWLGCHFIDFLRFATGLELVEVSALSGNVGGEDIDVEDVISLSVRLSNGAIGTMRMGYMLPQSQSGYERGISYDSYIGINGRDGFIQWDPHGPDSGRFLMLDRDAKSAMPGQVELTIGSAPGYCDIRGMRYLTELLDAVRNGTSPAISLGDGLAVLRFLDAAYGSAATGARTAVATGSTET